MVALPDLDKREAPVGTTEALEDQTATKPSNRSHSIAVPNNDTVFAVAWRRADPRTGRVRRVTAYRPSIEQARRVAAGAAEVAVDGPVIFATRATWQVTS